MQNLCLEVDDKLEESQKLWRYMDLSKFVSLIETNALWMARVDTFRDQHEGRFPDDMRKIIEKVYKNFELSEVTVVKDADDFQDLLAMKPNAKEIDEASDWIVHLDGNPTWPNHVLTVAQRLKRSLI